MDLRTFLSILLVYRSNFHVIHWLAKGEQFDTIHEKAADYYDMILTTCDEVAEMAMRIGERPVNYIEALKVVEDADKDYKILSTSSNYEFEDFKENTDIMFKDILECIEELLESDIVTEKQNVGIKAQLESIYNQYDLQLRYINKRR